MEMIIGLFSIFDPITLFFRNWVRVVIVIILFLSSYYISYTNFFSLIKSLIKYLYTEIRSIIINRKEGAYLIFILSLMFCVIFNNIMGLVPYVFTASRHLIYTLSLGLFIWLIRILLNLVKNIYHTLIHLTPIGTPIFLISFIVCIESLSLLIRPLTLSIRLMANIVAGHLLIVLLRNLTVSLRKKYVFFTRFVTVLLLILEFRVAIIQSYVFSILILLYLNEALYINKKWVRVSFGRYKALTLFIIAFLLP